MDWASDGLIVFEIDGAHDQRPVYATHTYWAILSPYNDFLYCSCINCSLFQEYFMKEPYSLDSDITRRHSRLCFDSN